MANLKRSEVDVNLTWDLSLIYPTEKDMFDDLDAAVELSKKIVEYKGTLNNSNSILEVLDLYHQYAIKEMGLSTYNELAVNEDFTNAYNDERNNKVLNVLNKCAKELSFLTSEIIKQDEAVIDEAIANTTAYKGFLEDIKRDKPHHLSDEMEEALITLKSATNVPYQVYLNSKLGDIRFPDFSVNGKDYSLSYTLFEDNYNYEVNTDLRRAAFDAFSKKIKEYENTTATAYNGQVQIDKALATLRGFESVFDYLLFDQKVTREMYDRQIDVIMEKFAPVMRKFAKLKQRTNKLDKMTFADLKISLDPEYVPSVTIPEAKKYCMDGLSSLGEEYVKMVEKAFDNRWIDFAQNEGKSTGGFCAAVYGKNCYVLLSYNARMSDVFTLAHELGHTGHFLLSSSKNSLFDTHTSTYFGEAPSTMNELIMAHYLLKTSDDPRFKRWVLSSVISQTYYHNFVTHLLEAAYQREVYRIVDAGGSVNASKLSEIKRNVLETFWGDAVEINEGAELTWMRQPHYYMGLYPYAYSAGLTVATKAMLNIEKYGQSAIDKWKDVLMAGSTKDPVGLAALADIDITTSEPLLSTIEYLDSIVDEIIKLTDQIEGK